MQRYPAVAGPAYRLMGRLRRLACTLLLMLAVLAGSACAMSARPSQAHNILYFSAVAGSTNGSPPSGVSYALNLTDGKQIWNADSAAGASAFADNMLYLGGGHTLLALNAASGAAVWRAAMTGGVLLPLAADNGVVLVNAVPLSSSISGPPLSTLEAFGASDGRLIWSVQVDSSILPWAIRGRGMLYVSATASIASPRGTPANSLLAISTTNGKTIWRAPLQNGLVVFSAPVVLGDVVYAAEQPTVDSTVGPEPAGHILAFKGSDGTQLWRKPIPVAGTVSGFAASDGAVYYSFYSVHGSHGVGALRANDGSLKWQAPSNASGAVAVGNGVVYGTDATISGQTSQPTVHAYDTSNGKTLWNQTLLNRQLTATGRVAQIQAIDGAIFVAFDGGTSQESSILALNGDDGSTRWVFPVKRGRVPGFIVAT